MAVEAKRPSLLSTLRRKGTCTMPWKFALMQVAKACACVRMPPEIAESADPPKAAVLVEVSLPERDALRRSFRHHSL